MSKKRLRKLLGNATRAEVAPGHAGLSNGDNSDSLYVILGGAAKALGKAAARELSVGDCFGEMPQFDGAPRSATQNVHVMRMWAQSVLRLARQHRALTLTMRRNFSTQLRRLEEQVAR